MTVGLPPDNPIRTELQPLIDLVVHADRLATFNQALHLHERDFSRFPVDFVEAVLMWARHKTDA